MAVKSLLESIATEWQILVKSKQIVSFLFSFHFGMFKRLEENRETVEVHFVKKTEQIKKLEQVQYSGETTINWFTVLVILGVT